MSWSNFIAYSLRGNPSVGPRVECVEGYFATADAAEACATEHANRTGQTSIVRDAHTNEQTFTAEREPGYRSDEELRALEDEELYF